MNIKRSSGILLHPTSFPSPYGIGSLGKEAYEFIDFLFESNQKLWQVFPLGPTGFGDSPYQCFSAFAGNPLFIDLDLLIKENLLFQEEILQHGFSNNIVDYGSVINFKFNVLKKSYHHFISCKNLDIKNEFDHFIIENKFWLDDYSLFMSLKDYFNGNSWNNWEKDIKFRKKEKISEYSLKLEKKINFYKYLQFIFFKQWKNLKNYANSKNISIIGDVPIFVAFDSSDAWSNPELFLFDEDRNPTKVAGVPPDYFSETGQLWGNPLYNWDYLEKTSFKWWVDRVKANLNLYDLIRIDHFRGFESFWAVPFGEKTAINGEWVKCPGEKLFSTLKKELESLPIIAEDLGIITPQVESLRDAFSFPGMKILQFAFYPGQDNPYLPHNHIRNCVVYTGTHDNDTTLGWYNKLNYNDKEYIKKYLNLENDYDISWKLIKTAWSSVANISITPLQDLLCLESFARINTPGKAGGNWQWRYEKHMLNSDISNKLKEITNLYFR